MATTRPPFASLSVAANLERHKLASDQPFILLLDLEYPGSADPTAEQFHVRLARNLHDVTFDAGDGFGPQVYQAFNFELGDFEQSSTGAIPESTIRVSNVMRILQANIKQYSGLVDANLNLYCLSAANPAGEAELGLSFTIKDTTSDATWVTFTLGASSPLRRLFPWALYRPNYCAWTYNSPALQAFAAANPTWKNPGRYCNYQGPMATCSHTLDGATGCRAHFPNTPMRALCFPGIDSNGAAVASVV